MSTNIENEILSEKRGPVMLVTLNRPATLNALSHNMIQRLAEGLAAWEKDPGIQVVVIQGAGGRAFCAGGDIKATWANRDNLSLNDRYFYDEYRLNRQLFHYPKPLIAFMDGITMGGGYGVAGPCQFRVATENTKWAMPETGIGFFPDIGSACSMLRAPGAMGLCLALTGMTIGPEDALYGGFATHYIYASALPDLLAEIKSGVPPARALEIFHRAPAMTGPLCRHQDVIDRCFDQDSALSVAATLGKDASEWAATTLQLLLTRSPLAVALAFQRMKRAEGQDFDQTIEDDYVIARHFMRSGEFFEGVRAMLVDKDKAPRWTPGTLDKVTETLVSSYFEPLPGHLSEGFKG